MSEQHEDKERITIRLTGLELMLIVIIVIVVSISIGVNIGVKWGPRMYIANYIAEEVPPAIQYGNTFEVPESMKPPRPKITSPKKKQ